MSTKESLRVGIVGSGEVATMAHIPSLLNIRGAELIAICDMNEELARGVAERFRINRYYADFSEMLKKEGLDMVDICTGPKTHAPLAIEAMEAGCHVLVEKPMASSLKQADEMVAASKQNRVKLCVVHNKLFNPVVLKARSIVRQGAIGQLTGINVVVAGPRDWDCVVNKDHWCHKLPGGIFGESLPHPIYLAMAFLGNMEPSVVYAGKLSSHDWMVADELRVIVKGENGLGTITMSYNWPNNHAAILDIFGTKMNLHVHLQNLALTTHPPRGRGYVAAVLYSISSVFRQMAGTTAAASGVISGRYHNDHYTLIQRLVESIQNNREPPVTAEEGREVMKVYDKITAQIGSGHRSAQ